MKILLIEPDRILARQYVSALKAAGHQVTVAMTGQSAIQAADAQAPELVLVELQLKGHNGVEFLYEFRSYPEWQRIPVIALTLVPERALHGIQAAPLLGLSAYLYRPQTSLERLVDMVYEVATLAVS